MRYLAFLSLVLIAHSSAVGQAESSRFAFGLYVLNASGPGADIESHMSGSGFGETRPGGCFLGFCGGPTNHPYSTEKKLGFGLGAELRISRSLQAGLLFSGQRFGHTIGYREWGRLDIGQALLSVEPYLSVGLAIPELPLKIVLGGGPGIYSSSIGGEEVTQVGLLASAAIRASRSPFFVEARYVRRFVPARHYGPIEVACGPGSCVLPEGDAGFGGSALVLGFGISLGRLVVRS